MKRLLLTFVLLMAIIASFAQIPAGYYDGTENLSGNALKSVLHEIIDDHQAYSYNDLRDFILAETDEDPANPDNIILLYTGRSQAKSTFGGGPDDWNREHVWAKSHGDFGTYPPCGTDAHHLRPTDASVNSARGNLDFDNGGTPHPEATGCRYDSDSWEPRDEVKGDVARMLFYMAVRYEGDNGEPDLEVVDAVNTAPEPEHGKLPALLAWHSQDPPDAFEINRNEVIYSYQQNRNPFIDHPEFVAKIFGPSAILSEAEQPVFHVWYTKYTLHFNALEYGPVDATVALYSLNGRQVKTWTISSPSVELETGCLPVGVYMVVWHKAGYGLPYTQKVVIQ
ncbi:MAG: hypothetical protein EOL88_04140 [Bacteroidia bacterium]|nr:hypothetical protein [Bacteroidia bacterium]